MAGNSTAAGRSVTARALDLLGAFDADHPEATLTELARRSGMPPATAHRLAGELVAWGALDRGADGRYRIGLRLWRTGLLAPVSDRLRETALPFMQDLYEATRENIHLAVRDGEQALYVEKLSGHRSVPVLSRVGAHLPLHATGVGKALLAWSDEDVVRAYCDRPLSRQTRHTITERGRLLRELRTAVERGYASTSEEMSLGSCSVAVPVLTGGGPPAAALGIVVRTVRADLSRLVPALRAAAEGLGRRLAARED
jgi:DNA-binding IclR family transcriptional regulator